MESLKLDIKLKASCQQIYTDWLSSQGHTAITGGEAEVYNEVNSKFTAWDDYIQGQILELIPYSTIKMTWRTVEFAKSDVDSKVTVTLEKIGDSETLLTLSQTNLPNGTKQKYTDGWNEFYLEPMADYYNS